MKKKKLTKQEKKNINRIISKWSPSQGNMKIEANKSLFVDSGFASIIITTDLLLTGGSLLALVSLPPLLSATSNAALHHGKLKRKNQSGQKIKSNFYDAAILMKMDKKMTELFNEFSSTANKVKRLELRETMQELYDDTQSLSPLYTIIDSDDNKFKFLLVQGDKKLEFQEAINLRVPKIKSLGI